MKPAQLAMTLADPAQPSNESYFVVMYAARRMDKSRGGVFVFLDRAIAAGQILRCDAQVIWRGVFRVWLTPFD